MSEANSLKKQALVDFDGLKSHAINDTSEALQRALAYGLDLIEAMSPDQRAELAQRELSAEGEEILQRFLDSQFPGQAEDFEDD